jgi:Skp family chaperone for outer membrane proteins
MTRLVPSRRGARTFGVLAACVATAATAQVRIDPRAQPLAGDELRACVAARDRIADGQRRHDAAAAAHNGEAAALAEEGRTLAAALRALDATDAAAVETHNARNAERNTRVARLNARVATLEAEAAALQAEQADFRSRCTRRGFRAGAASAPR